MKSYPNQFTFCMIILVIVTGVTLLFTSCQEDEGFVSDINIFKSSTLLDNTDYVTFYEKELFVRLEGKPVTMTRQIGNSSIGNFEPCFLVYVQSGYDNANYVSSAVVKIDGIELLNTSDFSNTNSLYQFELCNLTETSIIELVIMGAPGSTLAVWIEGKPKNTIPTTGLIAYYPFNGTADDESGISPDGMIYFAELAPDRFGQSDRAYNFFTNDESRITLTPFSPPEVISVSLWFYPKTYGPGETVNSVLFSNIEKFVGRDYVHIQMLEGKIVFDIANSSEVFYRISSQSPIELNQWHHLVCIANEQRQMIMYLDNVLQSETLTWEGLFNGQTTTNIGNNVNDDDSFDGLLDDIRIYNKPLSITEVGALFNEGGYVPSVTVSDVDGNSYKTVKIGTQVWMAENLKTTRYKNGDIIGTTTPLNKDITYEAAPKYQWVYDYVEDNLVTYGRLYTWYTVTDNRSVCPDGWRLPTNSDWAVLINYLGGEAVAGGKLKETGLTHWAYPNVGATDDYSFTALPGGYRRFDGNCYQIGGWGYWWSADENSENSNEAWSRYIWNGETSAVYSYSNKRVGFSVRCIRN